MMRETDRYSVEHGVSTTSRYRAWTAIECTPGQVRGSQEAIAYQSREVGIRKKVDGIKENKAMKNYV